MTEQIDVITKKVWSICDVLRDDGVSYSDYLEQLTYLLFLKMAYEYSQPPYKKSLGIPEKFTWEHLRDKRGAELETQYKLTLEELGKQSGILGAIFNKAVNKINDATKFYRVVQMIDAEEWVKLSPDVKGAIYEGILAKKCGRHQIRCGTIFYAPCLD